MKVTTRLKRDEGFTLLELMVVVLVIGVLVTLAIPTFMSARRGSQDRAAQSSLRNAITTARVIATDKEDYAVAVADLNADGAPNDDLAKSEPSLAFVPPAANSADADEISVATDNSPGGVKHKRIVTASISKSGTCWYSQDISAADGGGLKWIRDDDAGVNCNAADGASLAYDDPEWVSSPGAAVDHDFP